MLPENTAALSPPTANPRRACGISPARNACAAVIVPVSAPCNSRSTISVPAVCAAPISDITTAPAKLARISMIRLP